MYSSTLALFYEFGNCESWASMCLEQAAFFLCKLLLKNYPWQFEIACNLPQANDSHVVI